MTPTGGGFCTECGFRIESFVGLSGCPSCGSTSVPCADDRQVSVSVNWHELHLLCVWAENYQRSANLGRSVYTIARRLQAQHPTMGRLTLAEEIGDIAKVHEVSVTDAGLRRDIAEQTGEETGLLQKPDTGEVR